MPITKSAKKAIRVSSRKKAVNDARKKTMKDIMKKIIKIAKTDKAAQKGVIKKNNAGRKKARLARLVK